MGSFGKSMDVASKVVNREAGITRAKNKLVKKASDARRTSVQRSFHKVYPFEWIKSLINN